MERGIGTSPERGPISVRRILFVSPVFPADMDRAVFGIFQRMRVLLDAAAATGAELRLLFFAPPGLLAAAPPPVDLRRMFADRWCIDADIVLASTRERPVNVWNTFVAPALDFTQHKDYWPYGGPAQTGPLARLAADCDLLIVHRLAAMVAVLGIAPSLPPVVFDMDDIEDVKMARDLARPSGWRARPLLRLQLPALRRLEHRALSVAACSLVCSEHDRAHLLAADPAWRIWTLENSVDTRVRFGTAPGRKRLFFIGAFSYQPNVDAADFLIAEVWPRVLAALPDAQLIVAGNRPERLRAFGATAPGVQFSGFVRDLGATYASIDVVCCPILSGGGTRIKILEAAAHGRPVVATTIGMEGLSFRAGEEILLADDAEGLARHCVALLADHERAAAMGARARARVAERHERSRVVADLSALYRTLARPAARQGP